jgi:3-oxoadipate enol-lactonase
MPTIDANGETLAYERAGSGPALVLIHSLGTNSWLWADQITRWKSDFDVIAFDARGHGGSTNNGGVTMKNVAADILAALDALGVGEATFLGISMGGLISAHINAAAPERVKSIVIADSFSALGAAGPEKVAAMEGRIVPMSMEDWGAAYAGETLLPTTGDDLREKLAGGIAAMEKENYLQTTRSVFTSDVSAEMAAITAPVLVVCGDKDDRTPPAASEKIAEIIPGAELKMIPDAAHLSNLDNPSGFHAAVDPFLAAKAAG